MSRSRYKFGEDGYPHFMTCTIVEWLPVFSDADCATIILDSWRFLQREREIKILAWVILENHLHWIGVGPQLSRRVAEFKSYTAHAIIELLRKKGFQSTLRQFEFHKQRHKVGQQYQVWQEGSHPQILESTQVALQKLEYIHNNPVRRGYVDDPVHWRYSSARAYAKQPTLLDVDKDWL